MGWLKTAAIGMAVAALAAGAARAGELELIYWGEGRLEWFQLDGASYSVLDDTVDIKNIYAGWHTMTYRANGTTHSLGVSLSDTNTAESNYWCMDLDLGRFDLLGGYECEEMWDYYYFFF